MAQCKTKIEYLGQKTSLLSWTEDMQCWSFSLPAGKEGACPMAVYGENSICGSCYAQLNRYNMPNVLNSQWIRFMWVKNCLRSIDGRQLFIDTMTSSIEKHVKNEYFRGHDSGDFFHPVYVDCWYAVCNSLPEIQFWFPTRSYWSKNATWQTAIERLAALSNVSLRPSALKYDEEAPVVRGLSAGTTVVLDENTLPDDTKLCPKTLNGGSCESNDCRSCWDKDSQIAYLVHGVMGKSKPYPISDRIKTGRAAMKQKFVTLTIGNQL